MNIFEKHENFEIEVLEKLKNARLLDSLVFGGGTMLRLCHELKRYSVDLDFWRIKDTAETILFDKIKWQKKNAIVLN
jgi:predicted nucleotidyltransferase component of viral defense system